ncbi:MAG TPA: LamG-like jellyroll fold domain-containing protein, partial [Planctomycetota bacterium]|nr:LamG-like jellyroll fold domain-containing protein [Planctomycetota bacterium]
IRLYWITASDWIRFQMYDGSDYAIRTAVLLHQTEYRVMATYDGVGGMALYLDGEEVGQQTYAATDFDCVNGTVGGDGATRDFLGALDDVTVFLRELSPADAKLWTRGGEVA